MVAPQPLQRLARSGEIVERTLTDRDLDRRLDEGRAIDGRGDPRRRALGIRVLVVDLTVAACCCARY
jgi:hypothetical protein